MQCFIFRSSRKADTYLYLRDKDGFSNLPDTLQARFGKPHFVMELELTGATTLARADADHVRRQLQEKRYYLQLPPDPFAGRHDPWA